MGARHTPFLLMHCVPQVDELNPHINAKFDYEAHPNVVVTHAAAKKKNSSHF